MGLDGQKSSFKQRMLNAPVITKKTIIPKQPVLYETTQKSVSRLLFEVISALKDHTTPITNQDIMRKTMIDILNNPELLEAIKLNDRIVFDEFKSTFQYIATFHIRDKVI
jgi:hypothetical protein